MKNKTTNFIKLGILLFGIPLLLFNCEKDETIENHINYTINNNINFSIKNSTELKNDISFNKAIQKVQKTKIKSSTKKQNVFSIDYSTIKIVQTSELTSYTLKINREGSQENSFENLVIQINKEQEAKAFIIKYIPDGELERVNQHNSYRFYGERIVTPMTYENLNTNILGKMVYECNNIYEVRCTGGTNGNCNGGYHIPGGQCYNEYSGCIGFTQVGMSCGYYDDGDNNPSSGGGGSQQGSNNGTGGAPSNGGVVTAPILDECPIDYIKDANGNCIEDNDCDTSKEDLKKIFPNISDANASTLASIINDKGKDFGIDSDEDLWHFLSQAGHETGGFNTLNVTESTYWTTASKLANTYKKFTMDSTLAANNNDIYYAPDYLQNSSGVANVAMCCKYDNGDVASGDGYKYRGRGLFQLTWKENYSSFLHLLVLEKPRSFVIY